MKVIVVRFAVGRLMKDPGRASHGPMRLLVPRGVAEKTDFERIRAEEPLHTGFVVHHQAPNQVPVARFVEAERLPRQDREPKAVERKPAIRRRAQPAGVSHEKQKVGVPAGAMGSMPRVRAALVAREIAHPKWGASWKCVGYFTRGALDRTDERLGTVSRLLIGPQPLIALAPVGEANGVV
jgi:hypothetical protein